jgi:hypothetical protein
MKKMFSILEGMKLNESLRKILNPMISYNIESGRIHATFLEKKMEILQTMAGLRKK